MFQVYKLRNDLIQLYASKRETLHLCERSFRIKKYDDLGLMCDDFIACFKVDKQHENGMEIHAINRNGLIYVYNFSSRKMITVLHARPEQLKRYFEALGLAIPNEVSRLMFEVKKRNETLFLNEI